MRWETNPRNVYQWHRWFAWYPVRYSHSGYQGPRKWIWLEWIDRMAQEGWNSFKWHYRLRDDQ